MLFRFLGVLLLAVAVLVALTCASSASARNRVGRFALSMRMQFSGRTVLRFGDAFLASLVLSFGVIILSAIITGILVEGVDDLHIFSASMFSLLLSPVVLVVSIVLYRKYRYARVAIRILDAVFVVFSVIIFYRLRQ